MPSKKSLIVLALVSFLLYAFLNSATAFELFPRPLDQYTVKRGDTLYGISGFYYANPSLWPFLWNQNPQITVNASSGAPEKQPLVPGTKVNLFHKRFAPTVVNQSYDAANGHSGRFAFFDR